MPVSTFRVGNAIVHRIVELQSSAAHALEFFPSMTREQLDEIRPSMKAPLALDDEDGVFLCFQIYVIRTDKHNILVDTCLGNDKERPWRPHWHQRKDTKFMASLAAVGLSVADIDYVLCTHLHTDHVGWNTRLENGRWVPTFPNARYLFGDKELEFWLQKNADTVVPAIADSVIPILDAKQSDIVSSDHALSDLVSLIPTPGHTVGHYAVALGKGRHDAVFTGDLIHSPVQARWTDLWMRLDYDRAQGTETRRRFLETYCETDTLCCFSHFPSPSRGYIERWLDGFRCRYVTE